MTLSRRSFLRGGLPTAHISSLVVQCRPENTESLISTLNTMDHVEVPEHCSSGKLVVLLETPGEAVSMDRISAIEHLPGVISAALVYHEIDNGTDANQDQAQ